MNIIVPRNILKEVSVSLIGTSMIVILGAVIANVLLTRLAHKLEVREFKDTNGYFISGMRVAWMMFVSASSITTIGCGIWLHIVQKRAKAVPDPMQDRS